MRSLSAYIARNVYSKDRSQCMHTISGVCVCRYYKNSFIMINRFELDDGIWRFPKNTLQNGFDNGYIISRYDRQCADGELYIRNQCDILYINVTQAGKIMISKHN